MARRRLLSDLWATYKDNVKQEEKISLEMFSEDGGTTGLSGTSQIVYIESSGPWEISSKPTWITLTPSSGKGGETKVTVSADEAPSTQDRDGEVIISSQSTLEQLEIEVSQQGIQDFIKVEEIDGPYDSLDEGSSTYHADWCESGEVKSIKLCYPKDSVTSSSATVGIYDIKVSTVDSASSEFYDYVTYSFKWASGETGTAHWHKYITFVTINGASFTYNVYQDPKSFISVSNPAITNVSYSGTTGSISYKTHNPAGLDEEYPSVTHPKVIVSADTYNAVLFGTSSSNCSSTTVTLSDKEGILYYKVLARDNQAFRDRNIKVTFTCEDYSATGDCANPSGYTDFTLSQGGYPYIAMNPSGKSVGANASSFTLSVSSNTSWTLSENSDWISSLSKTSGNSGLTSGIVCKYNENTNVATSRKGTITGRSDELTSVSATCVVTQSAATPYIYINGSTNGAASVSNSTTSYTITIESNDDWTLSVDKEEAGLTPYVGTGDSSSTINFPKNTKSEAIDYTITATTTYGASATFTLKQKGALWLIPSYSAGTIVSSADTSDSAQQSITIRVPSGATSVQVSFSSSGPWSKTSYGDTVNWCSANTTNGANGNVVTYTISANDSIEERTTESAFTYNLSSQATSDYEYSVIFIQEGQDPYLNLKSGSTVVTKGTVSSLGGTIKLNVDANCMWVESHTAGLTNVISAGNTGRTGGTVTIIVPATTIISTGIAVTYVVTVKTNDINSEITKTYTIKQFGVTPYVKFGSSSYSVQAGQTTVTASVLSNIDWIIEPDGEYVTGVEPTIGSGDDDKITFTIKNYTAITSTSATQVIKGKSADFESITGSTNIIIGGFVPYVYFVPTSSTVTADLATSCTVTVCANTAWSITKQSGSAYITSISKTSGTGNSAITFGIAQNTAEKSKSATVKVNDTTYGGTYSGTTKININAFEPYISVVKQEGTNTLASAITSTSYCMIGVSSNAAWEVTSYPDWVTLTNQNGTSSGNQGYNSIIRIEIAANEANTTGSLRSGEIKFTLEDYPNYSATYTIQQFANVYARIDVSTVPVDANGGNIRVSVTHNSTEAAVLQISGPYTSYTETNDSISFTNFTTINNCGAATSTSPIMKSTLSSYTISENTSFTTYNLYCLRVVGNNVINSIIFYQERQSYTISCSPSSNSVSWSGDSISIKISTNDTNGWEVSSVSNGSMISNVSEGDSGSGGESIQVKIEPSYLASGTISGTIVFACKSDSSVTAECTFTQSLSSSNRWTPVALIWWGATPSITSAATANTLYYSANTIFNYSYSGDGITTVQNAASPLIDNSVAATTGVLETVVVGANSGTTERSFEASSTLSVDGFSDNEVMYTTSTTFTQSEHVPYIRINPSAIQIGSAVTSITASLSASDRWSVENFYGNVTDVSPLQQTSGGDEIEISITLEPNTDTASKNSTITFDLPDYPTYTCDLNITQSGHNQYITIEPDSATVGASGGTVYAVVSASDPWKFTGQDDTFMNGQITGTTDDDGYSVTFVVDYAMSLQDKTYDIYVQLEDTPSVYDKLTITQKGATATGETIEANIYFNQQDDGSWTYTSDFVNSANTETSIPYENSFIVSISGDNGTENITMYGDGANEIKVGSITTNLGVPISATTNKSGNAYAWDSGFTPQGYYVVYSVSITIDISPAEVTNPTLSISGTSSLVAYDSTTITLSVSSNTTWKVWLYEGDDNIAGVGNAKTGSGNGTVTFTLSSSNYSAGAKTDERTFVFTGVTTSGASSLGVAEAEDSCSVTQSGCDDRITPTITVTSFNTIVSGRGSFSAKVKCTENIPWKANVTTINGTVLGITGDTGTGNGTIELDVSGYTATTYYTITVTTTADSSVVVKNVSDSCTVQQEPASTIKNHLEGDTTIEADETGTTITVVTTNDSVTWTLDGGGLTPTPINPSGLVISSSFELSDSNNSDLILGKIALGATLSPSAGTGTTYVLAKIPTSETSVTITAAFVGGTPGSDTLTITRKGTLKLTGSSSVGSGVTSTTLTITTVNATDTWTLSSSDSWCTLSQASGTGGKSVTVTFSTNTATVARSTTFTLTSNGNSVTLTLTQDKGAVENTVISLNFVGVRVDTTDYLIAVLNSSTGLFPSTFSITLRVRIADTSDDLAEAPNEYHLITEGDAKAVYGDGLEYEQTYLVYTYGCSSLTQAEQLAYEVYDYKDFTFPSGFEMAPWDDSITGSFGAGYTLK